MNGTTQTMKSQTKNSITVVSLRRHDLVKVITLRRVGNSCAFTFADPVLLIDDVFGLNTPDEGRVPDDRRIDTLLHSVLLFLFNRPAGVRGRIGLGLLARTVTG